MASEYQGDYRSKWYVYEHRTDPTAKAFHRGYGQGKDAWDLDNRSEQWHLARAGQYVHVTVTRTGLSKSMARRLAAAKR